MLNITFIIKHEVSISTQVISKLFVHLYVIFPSVLIMFTIRSHVVMVFKEFWGFGCNQPFVGDK